MKFLIDECLSPALAAMAHETGYDESSHVVWRGWSGLKDRELKMLILRDDWTFVTRNAIDFRGPPGTPGSKGEYASVELHAGLVCLNAPGGMDLGLQKELFKQALDELDRDPDLINQVMEITFDEESLIVRRYMLPAE